jgi:hypothetical protein
MSYRDDNRLNKIETIHVTRDAIDRVISAREDDDLRDERTPVLRLYPPFEAEMEVEYHESVTGRHYNSDWDEKPIHIPPNVVMEDLAGAGGDSVLVEDGLRRRRVPVKITES